MDYIWWDHWVLEFYLIKQFTSVTVEWWEASYHLKNDGSQAPPIDRFAVAFFEKNFRREILRCATDG